MVILKEIIQSRETKIFPPLYQYSKDSFELYEDRCVEAVNSFKWGTWVFLSAFIGHPIFIQGTIQSGEDFYP